MTKKKRQFRSISETELQKAIVAKKSFRRSPTIEMLWPYAAVALGTLLLFIPSLAQWGNNYLGYVGTDMNIAYRHYLTFGVRWLRQGIIPQWNPHIFCGTVFLPSTCATLYHPINLLILTLFPLPLAANLAILFHVAVLGCAVAYWGKLVEITKPLRVVAGILAVASSAVVGRIYAGHFTILCTLPWAICFLASVHAAIRHRPKQWLMAACFAALMLLGGHLQMAYYAFLLGTVVVISALAQEEELDAKHLGRTMGLYAAACAAAALLAAIELVPVIDTIRTSARVATADTAWIRRFSLPVENLLMLFYPNILGTPSNYMGRWFWWEASPVSGVGVLLLALAPMLILDVDRLRKFGVPLALLGVSTLLAIVMNIPYLADCMRFLPGWRALRGHAKIFAFGQVVLPLLATAGLEALLRGEKRVRDVLLWACFLVGLGAAALVAGVADNTVLAYARSEGVLRDRLYGPDPFTPSGVQTLSKAVRAAGWHTLVMTLLLGCLTFSMQKFGRIALPMLVSTILAEGLILSVPLANVNFLPSDQPELSQISSRLKADGRADRIEMLPDGLVNAAMSYDLLTPGGNDVNVSRYYDTFLSAVDRQFGGEPHLHVRALQLSVLWNYAALRYLLIPSNQQVREDVGLAKVQEMGGYTVWERNGTLPYAHMASRIRWVPDDERQIFDALAETTSSRTTEHTILVGNERPLPPLSTQGPKTLRVKRNSPGTIEISVDSAGLLVVAEGYSPHWHAYDATGQALPVMRANGAFLAIPVENASGGTVTLRYENPAFFLGRLITFVSIILACGLAILAHRKTRKAISSCLVTDQ